MVSFFSNWAQNIIVSVIIVTIIEMILPKNNNKKYVQMVIGIFITFTIISPIISKFSNVDELKNTILNYEQYMDSQETYSSIRLDLEQTNDSNLQKVYLSTLENDLKSRLKNKGYEVSDMSLDVDLSKNNFGIIKNIKLKLTKLENVNSTNTNSNQKVNTVEVEKVQVSNSSNDSKENEQIDENKLTQEEISEIKNYLSMQYEINTKNINIS